MLETAKDESNKRKVEAKNDLEGDCSTMRNALSEEKLNHTFHSKSLPTQIEPANLVTSPKRVTFGGTTTITYQRDEEPAKLKFSEDMRATESVPVDPAMLKLSESKGGDKEKIEQTAQDIPEGAAVVLDEWRRLEGNAERARASMAEAAANAEIVRGAIAAMDGGASIREVMSEPVEAALRRIASDSAQTPAQRQLAERLLDLKGRSTTPESSEPLVFRPPLATVSPPGASERLQRLMAPKTHKKGKKGKQLRSSPGTPLARDNSGKHKTT